ncbi:MAG: BTAD domain-containing putative transcriptional regulator [Acidobacteria bacterium]|nr:BTAD domain-containing putative transcriptional regulator [Acidobacteriota bacterium]
MTTAGALLTGLKLYLLGPFRVVVDGVDLDTSRWPRKSARLVIKLLALAPGHKMHREQLIEALSPDGNAETGLNRFHKAIHAARSALEPDLAKVALSRFIITQDTQVYLSAAALEIDVEAFERLAAQALQNHDTASLQNALALYAGDLLEEDLYEDWTALHRERLRITHQRLLGALSANLEAAGDWKILDVVQRLLAAFPADEEAHRRLMRFYTSHGQRHLALEQFRLCTESLRQHLDVVPSKSTLALHQSILDGTLPPAPPPPPSPFANPHFQSRPSRSLLLLAAGIALAALLAVWWFRPPAPARPLSLAILPLRSAPSLVPVADGLTEGLINSASRLPGLKVMARTTAFAFKNRTDGWQVGRELNVTYVISGGVVQEEGKISVSLELVDVADGSRSWGRRYSVDPKDAPSIQQLLNSELASALKLRAVAPVSRYAANLDAETYQLYLTGRQLGNERTLPSLKKSIEIYQQAIDRNPNYALAYAGLADSYGLLGFQDAPPADFYPKTREAATKALELDPGLAEAQTSLAMVSALYDWNWAAAEAQFRRAIEMNPGYVTAHHWLGVHLAAMGRFDEARAELSAAASLDPKSAIVALNVGYPDLYQRKLPEALQYFDRALALAPNLSAAHSLRSTVFDLQQKPAPAAAAWVAWLLARNMPALAETVKPAADRGDYPTVLRQTLQAFETPASNEYLSPMFAAVIAARLGDAEKAFLWLDRGFAQRCPQLVYLAVDPRYDPLRRDPRFAALLNRIGLPSR